MIPKIRVAMNGWETPITFKKLNTSIDGNYDSLSVFSLINFKGVMQPLNPRQIMLKPEGQRAWQWFQVHCRISLSLEVNDRIIYNDVRYKVMAVNPYDLNNYFEYHIVKDYQ